MERLFKIVQELGGCNQFPVKDVEQWPDLSQHGFYLVGLKQEAESLPGSEIHNFCDGEVSEVQKLVNRYGLAHLNDFLNSVFDGDLHDLIAADLD